MGKTTIEWTEHSINPFRARNKETGAVGHFCAKVSDGCKFCYSSALQPRFGLFPFLAENRDKVELFLDDSKLQDVLRRRVPTKYFWCDMTDMFMDDYPDEWIDRCFAVMALTPQHTHQVLTKRPERMLKYLTAPRVNGHGIMTRWGFRASHFLHVTKYGGRIDDDSADLASKEAERRGPAAFPLPNVWLGISCENQPTADERIPLLLQTPAAVRFVSYEPALVPVILHRYLTGHEEHGIDLSRPIGSRVGCCVGWTPPLDWVIVGGESGPNARPFDIQWARDVIAQCKAAGVACFVKQLGANPIDSSYDSGFLAVPLLQSKGGDWSEWPEDLRVREFPDSPKPSATFADAPFLQASVSGVV